MLPPDQWTVPILVTWVSYADLGDDRGHVSPRPYWTVLLLRTWVLNNIFAGVHTAKVYYSFW